MFNWSREGTSEAEYYNLDLVGLGAGLSIEQNFNYRLI